MPKLPASAADLPAPAADLPAQVEFTVELLAEAMELCLLPEERHGVAQTYATLHAIAQALLRFPLPEDTESAEVFQP
jgi:hypothetical protein